MYKDISLSNCLVRIRLYDAGNKQIDLKNYVLDEAQIQKIQTLAEQIFTEVGSKYGTLSLNTSYTNSYNFDGKTSQNRKIYNLGLSVIREFSYRRVAHAHFDDDDDESLHEVDSMRRSSRKSVSSFRLDLSRLYLVTPRSSELEPDDRSQYNSV